MQVYPIHPYILERFIQPKLVSSLFSKIGVGQVPVLVPSNLTAEEAMIQHHLGEMMAIIERHLMYWKDTKSTITLNALCSTESVLTSLLTALYKPDNRAASIIIILYDKDLKRIIKSMRSPRARRNSSPSASLIAFRENVIQDRATFKLYFRRIIESLKTLCKPETNQNVINLSPENLNRFFEEKLKQEQEIEPEVDIDTEEANMMIKEEELNPLTQ